jgi:hypothetical protein
MNRIRMGLVYTNGMGIGIMRKCEKCGRCGNELNKEMQFLSNKN